MLLVLCKKKTKNTYNCCFFSNRRQISLKRYSKVVKVFALMLLVVQLGVVLLYGHNYNILSWTSSSKYIILSLLMLLTLIVPVYGYLVSMGVCKNNKLLINNDN